MKLYNLLYTLFIFITVSYNVDGKGDANLSIIKTNSRSELSVALENRWSIKRIEIFCILETERLPHFQALVADGDETWRGIIHKNNKSIGVVTWYANIRKGKIESISIDVAKGNHYWNLETIILSDRVLNPLTDVQVELKKMDAIIWNSLHAYQIAMKPKGNELKLYRQYSNMLFRKKYHQYFEKSGNTKYYIRKIDDQKKHILRVELNKKTMPEIFYLSKEKDKYLNNVYRIFLSNFSEWLKVWNAEF